MECFELFSLQSFLLIISLILTIVDIVVFGSIVWYNFKKYMIQEETYLINYNYDLILRDLYLQSQYGYYPLTRDEKRHLDKLMKNTR